MKTIAGTALIAALLLPATVAVAATAADIITSRQKLYKEIAKSAKAIGDELKTPAPSLDLIRQNAKAIDALAPRVPRWYPKGSGPEAGVKTEALPDIWAKPQEFKKAAAAFATASRALRTASAGTDVAAIGTAFRAMGGTCKGCHDQFRAKK